MLSLISSWKTREIMTDNTVDKSNRNSNHIGNAKPDNPNREPNRTPTSADNKKLAKT
jgi:hypothetical protein